MHFFQKHAVFDITVHRLEGKKRLPMNDLFKLIMKYVNYKMALLFMAMVSINACLMIYFLLA